MKMKKSQFREDAATYIQMIHLLNEYNPGWKIILIGVLLEGIFPFIAINCQQAFLLFQLGHSLPVLVYAYLKRYSHQYTP